MRRIALALAVALGLVSMPTMAADPGFYFGAGIGQFSTEIDQVNLGDLRDQNPQFDEPAYRRELSKRYDELYGSKIASQHDRGSAGTVLAISETGIEVAAAGGSVLLAKLGVGGKKIAATEAAASLGLTVGARLGAGHLPVR